VEPFQRLRDPVSAPQFLLVLRVNSNKGLWLKSHKTVTSITARRVIPFQTFT